MALFVLATVPFFAVAWVLLFRRTWREARLRKQALAEKHATEWREFYAWKASVEDAIEEAKANPSGQLESPWCPKCNGRRLRAEGMHTCKGCFRGFRCYAADFEGYDSRKPLPAKT